LEIGITKKAQRKNQIRMIYALVEAQWINAAWDTKSYPMDPKEKNCAMVQVVEEI